MHIHQKKVSYFVKANGLFYMYLGRQIHIIVMFRYMRNNWLFQWNDSAPNVSSLLWVSVPTGAPPYHTCISLEIHIYLQIATCNVRHSPTTSIYHSHHHIVVENTTIKWRLLSVAFVWFLNSIGNPTHSTLLHFLSDTLRLAVCLSSVSTHSQAVHWLIPTLIMT